MRIMMMYMNLIVKEIISFYLVSLVSPIYSASQKKGNP